MENDSQAVSPIPPDTDLVNRTRQTLNQTLSRYSHMLQGSATAPQATGNKTTIKAGINQLQTLTAKLDSRCLKVAVFGLVSRGKSAVINALVGESVLETGPLHGVTRWPRSVYWQPEMAWPVDGGPWQVELVDTPGLDEIGGDMRAEMSQTVAHQADLILFVVAGEITRSEYAALIELQQEQKPILLVFNKTDLYPEIDRQAIYDALHDCRRHLSPLSPEKSALAIDQVVMVAASPAPLSVRVEWPDGRTSQEWETPPAQIAPLKDALLKILQQDGPALIALNALRSARQVETQVVSQVSQLYDDRADEVIWQFARYKAIAVALNPIAVVDVLGGAAIDFVMIRTLAHLYGFPITSYEASRLWQAILKSSGVLLLSELGSVLLGAGKTTAAMFSLLDSATGITALAGAVTAQASAAGYGSFAVGRATKTYLAQGCTWGPEGISAVMAEILSETDTADTLSRLKQDIGAELARQVAKAEP
jgi:small GTP-binding protein